MTEQTTEITAYERSALVKAELTNINQKQIDTVLGLFARWEYSTVYDVIVGTNWFFR